MRVTICGESIQLDEGTTLLDAVTRHSPYGSEATICRLNGRPVKSIDMDDATALKEGDVVDIFPLIIGG